MKYSLLITKYYVISYSVRYDLNKSFNVRFYNRFFENKVRDILDLLTDKAFSVVVEVNTRVKFCVKTAHYSELS